jgi:hypothetical protein
VSRNWFICGAECASSIVVLTECLQGDFTISPATIVCVTALTLDTLLWGAKRFVFA